MNSSNFQNISAAVAALEPLMDVKDLTPQELATLHQVFSFALQEIARHPNSSDINDLLNMLIYRDLTLSHLYSLWLYEAPVRSNAIRIIKVVLSHCQKRLSIDDMLISLADVSRNQITRAYNYICRHWPEGDVELPTLKDLLNSGSASPHFESWAASVDKIEEELQVLKSNSDSYLMLLYYMHASIIPEDAMFQSSSIQTAASSSLLDSKRLAIAKILLPGSTVLYGTTTTTTAKPNIQTLHHLVLFCEQLGVDHNSANDLARYMRTRATQRVLTTGTHALYRGYELSLAANIVALRTAMIPMAMTIASKIFTAEDNWGYVGFYLLPAFYLAGWLSHTGSVYAKSYKNLLSRFADSPAAATIASTNAILRGISGRLSSGITMYYFQLLMVAATIGFYANFESVSNDDRLTIGVQIFTITTALLSVLAIDIDVAQAGRWGQHSLDLSERHLPRYLHELATDLHDQVWPSIEGVLLRKPIQYTMLPIATLIQTAARMLMFTAAYSIPLEGLRRLIGIHVKPVVEDNLTAIWVVSSIAAVSLMIALVTTAVLTLNQSNFLIRAGDAALGLCLPWKKSISNTITLPTRGIASGINFFTQLKLESKDVENTIRTGSRQLAKLLVALGAVLLIPALTVQAVEQDYIPIGYGIGIAGMATACFTLGIVLSLGHMLGQSVVSCLSYCGRNSNEPNVASGETAQLSAHLV